eukprot:CAMPEP_0118901306 /NCGR_PEP_ID=MMETSP1166-20130328/7063_1 /TAXON_ID=1104430 /ORGANISM="Chrysoreinhardia sp, Strain CCMP3193" /LENGTH=973 /DNA_ID=CAMNT_0006840477 /DNA_START=37 /DNA_END=2958 /DNA_ORIENTATION=-
MEAKVESLLGRSSGEITLQLVNDVFAEIDPTVQEDMSSMPEDGIDKMMALLEVLGLKAPASERAGFRERLRRGERRLLVAVLDFALTDLLKHKKKVYDARFQLPVAIVAGQTPPPLTDATYDAVARAGMPSALGTSALEKKPSESSSSPALSSSSKTGTTALRRQKFQKKLRGVSERLFEQLIEVGLPDAWDAARLVELASGDETEAKARPWLTVKQRWKASARWLVNASRQKKTTKHKGPPPPPPESLPPKDSLHPTEAGAFSPRVLWSLDDDDASTKDPLSFLEITPAEIASFCFPAGVDVARSLTTKRKDDASFQTFVFRIAVPVPDERAGNDEPAPEENTKSPRSSTPTTSTTKPPKPPPTTLLYGVCVVDKRLCETTATSTTTTTSTIEIPRCFCLLTKLPFLELHCRVLRSAVRFAKRVAATSGGGERRVRDVVRRVVGDHYGKLAVPAPGHELRCQLPSSLSRSRSRDPEGGLDGAWDDDDASRLERKLEEAEEERPSDLRKAPPPTTTRSGGHVTELVFERPLASRSTDFLEEALASGDTASVVQSCPEAFRWALRDLEHLDQAADWSVPVFLASVPASNVARVLAAALCELQIVVLSKQCGVGAAACLGLAALVRPLLWVGPLVPALPTQLHSILEAPTPYIVATPRTPVWVDCIADRLPHPGLVVLDVDAAAVHFHPSDADLVELPNARALLDALQPALAVVRADATNHFSFNGGVTLDGDGDGDPLRGQQRRSWSSPPEVTPRMRKAARSAQRVVARHVARLCRITMCLDDDDHRKTAPRDGLGSVAPPQQQRVADAPRSIDARSVRIAKAVDRTRESVEFAALLRRELADEDALRDDDDDDDDDRPDDEDDGLPEVLRQKRRKHQPTASRAASSLQALRESIDHSFLDVTASHQWQRQSSDIRDHNYLHPLRRVFFERVYESQSFAVFREAFPAFCNHRGPTHADDQLRTDVSTMLGLPRS